MSYIFSVQLGLKAEAYSRRMALLYKGCMCALSLQSCSTLCDPMGCSPLGSSVIGFFRQEYRSGFPCPPSGDLPDTGVESASPASNALKTDSLPNEPLGKPYKG